MKNIKGTLIVFLGISFIIVELGYAQPKIPKGKGESTVNKLACKKECSELLKKGQLRQGVTLEECIKALCKPEHSITGTMAEWFNVSSPYLIISIEETGMNFWILNRNFINWGGNSLFGKKVTLTYKESKIDPEDKNTVNLVTSLKIAEQEQSEKKSSDKTTAKDSKSENKKDKVLEQVEILRINSEGNTFVVQCGENEVTFEIDSNTVILEKGTAYLTPTGEIREPYPEPAEVKDLKPGKYIKLKHITKNSKNLAREITLLGTIQIGLPPCKWGD